MGDIIGDALKMVTKRLHETQRSEEFYDVPEEEYDKFPDRVERHCMSNRHTEILGQFLDQHPIDEETLKDVLLDGLFSVGYKYLNGEKHEVE